MNHLRLALVTPRYWPHAGHSERLVSHLAEEFRRQGAAPLVVTAKWSGDWPSEVWHREIPVVRLPAAPRGGWGTLRYMRELSRWLRQHRDRFDLVYIANLRYDAYAGVGALQERDVPIVLRAGQAGPAGDCQWQESARFGHRIRRRCCSAQAIVANSKTVLDELLAAGYSPERIHQIPSGAGEIIDRSPPRRFQARTALGEINHDLATADYAPVAVCLERLEEGRGLFELVAAWRAVAARWPSARLWLIGDGPLREALYQKILDGGLHRQILMPGSFDDLEDVFHAADVFISPSADEGGALSLIAALAAGLPVVAVSTAENLDMMEDKVHGILIPRDERGALSAAISRLFEMPSWAAQLGDAGRRHAERRFSLERAAARHLELFSRLAAAGK